MLKVRPFQRHHSEYHHVVQLHNAIWSDRPTTLVEWKHFEATADPSCVFREHVAEVEGTMAGYLFYCEPWWWERTSGTFFLEMLVHPNHQGQGLGKALYNAMLEELQPFPSKSLFAKTREDQANAIGFLKRMGFAQTMRYPRSQLALEALDLDKFAPLCQRVQQQGVCIYTLSQLQQADPQWKEKLYELRWQINQDVPSPTPRRKPTLEEFEKQFLHNPQLDPQANFIAVEGDQYVGFSNLWPKRGAHKINTGLSGVIRSHRRRGICTALKVHGFQFAKQYGACVVETENEENNPMYQLNLQLGFQPKPAWLDFKKVFNERSHP